MSCLNRLLVLFNYRLCLIIPCEVASKSVIPALRALVARELIEEYGLNQDQVRGEAVELEAAPEVKAMSKDLASMLTGNPNPLAVSQKLCQACTDIRALGLMCETCRKVDPTWDVEHCTICFGNHSCSELVSIEPSSIGKYRRIPVLS